MSAPSYDQFESLVDESFPEVVRQRQELVMQKDQLETAIRELNDQIGAMLTIAGTKSAATDEYTVTLVESPGRETLSKERLLELGAGVDVLRRATVSGKPYSTVMVKPRKIAGVGVS